MDKDRETILLYYLLSISHPVIISRTIEGIQKGSPTAMFAQAGNAGWKCKRKMGQIRMGEMGKKFHYLRFVICYVMA